MVERQDVHGGWKATTLSVQLAAGATSLSVVTDGLDTWTPVLHGKIPVTINRGQVDEEHLYATAVSGDSLTGLTRGADGTVDQTHAAGATVEHTLFAEHIDDANALASLPTAAGQFLQSTGADTWGVTAAPTITDFSNAAHDHGDADDGGALAAGLTLTSATLTSPVINDGAVNLDGGSLVVPLSDGPTQTADGSIVWMPGANLLTIGTGTDRVEIVNRTGAQTLTDKTLLAPVIADFTNAQHDHRDADDGGVLVPAWTDYTATVTGAGSNPNLGATGFASGRYMQLGRLVVVSIQIVWGGAGVTGGSGGYTVALPVAARTSGATTPTSAGGGHIRAAAGQAYVVSATIVGTNDGVRLYVHGTSTVASATSPFAFGTAGDAMQLHLTYEAEASA